MKLAPAIALILTAWAVPVSAAILPVPADFATIQAAVDAAAPGDEVVIAPGIYTGDGNRDIDFHGKRITVRSADPADPAIVAATVIDCNGTHDEYHRGLIFQSGESDTATVDGIHIVNGRATTGGAILCRNASSPTIRRCIFSLNGAHSGNGTPVGCGGAIAALDESSPCVDSCLFDTNVAWRYGGAVYFGPPSTSGAVSAATVTNCRFVGNITGSTSWLTAWPQRPQQPYGEGPNEALAGYGGGLYIGRGPYPVGGPVPPFRDSVEVSDCLFRDNGAQTTGGLYVVAGSAVVTRCSVVENTAGTNGGCHISGSPAEVSHCLIRGNSATADVGGMRCAGSATISSCDILANGAGGLYASGGVFRLAIDPNTDNLSVLTARGDNHYVFTSAGNLLVDETLSPRAEAEMDDRIEQIVATDSTGCTYKIRDHFLFTRVVRTCPDGSEKVVVSDPFYLWIIKGPLPAWLLILVGGLTSRWLNRMAKK